MIKKLLLASVFLFSIQLKSISQVDIDTKLNLLKLQPEIGVEAGSGKLGFELNVRYLYKPWVAAITLNDPLEETTLEEETKRSGFDFTLKSHIYLSPEYSLDRWRVSPYLKYRMQTIKYAEPIKNTRISAGLMIGRKGFITERLGWEFDLGFGKPISDKYVNTVTKAESEVIENTSGLFVKLLNSIDLPFNVSLVYRFGEGFPK